MRLGKYEIKIIFRLKSLWLGIYPNPIKGKCCIAFFPFFILRIIDKEHKWSTEIEQLQEKVKKLESDKLPFTIYRPDYSSMSWRDNCRELGVEQKVVAVDLMVQVKDVVYRTVNR